MKKLPTILVIAHAHPDFSKGGGEIAAYSIFSGYNKHPLVGKAYFLSFYNSDSQDGFIKLKRNTDNEYLWQQIGGNWFYMDSKNSENTRQVLTDFLDFIKPDIIHFHHGINIGYECLEIIKKHNPNIKIYFTLHEYLPICARDGQMVKSNGKLCKYPSAEECHICLSYIPESDFFIRKNRLIHFFKFVDKFITPSNFLQKRFIEWGLPPEKMYTIENGIRNIPDYHIDYNSKFNRFGFFGSINPYKGLKLIFQAFDIMTLEQRRKFVFEINGANFDNQPDDFKKEINNYVKKFEPEGFLRWNGPYEPVSLVSRMCQIDWVVVPSIWWENSPIVIQESFACRKPVICSNIGGMKEKVKNNVNGIHVKVNDKAAWKSVLLNLCNNKSMHLNLCKNIKKPMTIDDSVNKHLELMDIIKRDW